MTKNRGIRLNFYLKMLANFSIIGAIMIAIFIFGNQTNQATFELLNKTVKEHVQPLAQINRLQSHANKIRLLEAELPKISDYLAVIGIVNELKKESEVFVNNFNAFLSSPAGTKIDGHKSLINGWRLYQKNLEQSLEFAMDMDLKSASKVSTYSSSPRYHIFAQQLKQISQNIEEKARQEYIHSINRYKTKQHAFSILSIIAIVVSMICTFFLTRSISIRVKGLSKSANRIAEGETEHDIQCKGNDEIGDLALSFDTMRVKIQKREASLRQAQEKLELRVEERTAELKKANEELQAEIIIKKLTEKALRKSEEKSLAIIKAIPDFMFQFKKDGTFLSFEGPTENLYKKPEVFIQNNVKDILPPELADLTMKYIKQALDTNELQIYEYELPINEKICHFESRMVLSKSNEVLAIVRDITEKKQAEEEKEKLRKNLQYGQRMESIGTLAGGIAHDFNNIIGIILGNTELAVDNVPRKSSIRQNLEEIHTASLRAQDVVRQLLNFSRDTEQQRRPLNMASVVKESLNLLRAIIPSSIEIQVKIDNKLNYVYADATQIHQLMINLCTNASHAMKNNIGTIEVHLRNRVLKQKDPAGYYHINPGAYVELNIRDTGEGIPSENLDRVFDPYFTTKEVGKGSGMGLAVVHGIVSSHDGAIHVESEPGKGSDFSILFPAIKATEEIATPSTKKPLPQGSEKILLIDDEKALLEMNRQILNRLGYDVEAQTNPMESIERFRSDPAGFDLVITDMTMPQMTGDQLSLEILKIRPDIPVILCTGFSEKITEKNALKLGVTRYLEKPLDSRKLAETVKQVLDEARNNS